MSILHRRREVKRRHNERAALGRHSQPEDFPRASDSNGAPANIPRASSRGRGNSVAPDVGPADELAKAPVTPAQAEAAAVDFDVGDAPAKVAKKPAKKAKRAAKKSRR